MISSSALLLVLASALAHAAWNAILKKSRDAESAAGAMLPIASALSIALALMIGGPRPSVPAVGWSMVAGFFEAAYLVTLARALQRAPLGSVYTIVRGGGLLIVWPISVVALGERSTLFGALGTVVVLGGLALVGASQRSAATNTTTVRSGLVIAALCGVFVAGYHVCDKIALARGASPFVVDAISLSLGTGLSIVIRGVPIADSIAAFRERPTLTILGGVLSVGGFTMFLMAMNESGAGLVMTLRNTSILFAQGFAFLLGEIPTRRSLVGAVLVTGGAILLAM